MSRSNLVQIDPGLRDQPLSPAQKRFNTLTRQILQARESLTAWHEGTATYRDAYARLLVPLQDELLAARRQWVLALDVLLGQRHWTRPERQTLRDLLCETAGELLEVGDDDALKALFDKHAEVDFDTEQRETARAMKDMAELMTGLDLGDDDGIANESDLMARLEQGLQQQAEAQAGQADPEAGRARRRRGAARQRQQAQAQQATLSVREIYRKLASALHPDRETDPTQRDDKTALMQRVNQAYAANDLLTLLQLQIEIEQIDADHIAGVSAERLKHYNQVLAQQLEEIRAEIARVDLSFRMDVGLSPVGTLNPRKLGAVLEQGHRQWRADLAEQQQLMRQLGDLAALKRWLKRERQRQRDEAMQFNPF